MADSRALMIVMAIVVAGLASWVVFVLLRVERISASSTPGQPPSATEPGSRADETGPVGS
jgi:hypothetical protein